MLRENENHALVPGNPMYAEIILRYPSATEQKRFYNDYRAPFWLKPDGSLDASSNGDGAGIGGGSGISCGNIVIEGGTITATGTPSRRPRLLSAGGFWYNKWHRKEIKHNVPHVDSRAGGDRQR